MVALPILTMRGPPSDRMVSIDTSLPGCSFRRLSELSAEELKQKLLGDEDDKADKED